MGNQKTELLWDTCRMGSYNVTCHPT